MIEAKDANCRNALAIPRDGRVYSLIHVENETGFGEEPLHHLTRFNPKTAQTADVGVLAVKNPDCFDWSPLWNGKQKPWTAGFPTLPDGTMTPAHAHMGLILTRNGTMYVTLLAPFTLLNFQEDRFGHWAGIQQVRAPDEPLTRPVSNWPLRAPRLPVVRRFES